MYFISRIPFFFYFLRLHSLTFKNNENTNFAISYYNYYLTFCKFTKLLHKSLSLVKNCIKPFKLIFIKEEASLRDALKGSIETKCT